MKTLSLIHALLYGHSTYLAYEKGPGIVQQEFYGFRPGLDQLALRLIFGVNLFHNRCSYS